MHAGQGRIKETTVFYFSPSRHKLFSPPIFLSRIDIPAADPTGLVTPGPEGMITPSGLTSMPVGIETPDVNIQLRKTQKANIEAAMDAGDERPSLFQVGTFFFVSRVFFFEQGCGSGGKKVPSFRRFRKM